MQKLFEPLRFRRGPAMAHRLALAPLTNGQSAADGRLGEEELHWLRMRAQGGFAMTMTCAAHVQAVGQGFGGQLGIFEDAHLPGLGRLAQAIRAEGSLAIVQLHHGGMRALPELIGRAPLSPSGDAKFGSVAMGLEEVEQMIQAFIQAAQRAEKAGFDGVELHGAHGYLLAQFLSPTLNQRSDAYGGSFDKRCRVIWAIAEGIRQNCGPDFQLGIRLSAERFGIELPEMQQLSAQVMASGLFDFLDLSLWDVFKRPQGLEEGPSLLEHFLSIPREGTRLAVAGKIRTPAEALSCMEQGVDFVFLGRAAVVDHDFPRRLRADAAYQPTPMPASVAHLRAQGVSPPFVEYLRRFDGMVAEESA